MAFEQVDPRVPSSIGDIKFTLMDLLAVEMPTGPIDARQAIAFDLQVMDADGLIIRNVAGDLAPHLTQPQIDQLKAFMDTMRAKAETEILP